MNSERIREWALKLAASIFDNPTTPYDLTIEPAVCQLVNEAYEEAAMEIPNTQPRCQELRVTIRALKLQEKP